MAEERLIDEDKNRKYKIRINEDGEEELVLVEPSDDGDDEGDIPVFEIPEYEEDDEEAAVLTPEQLAERNRLKEEEEKSREEKLKIYINDTRKKLEEGDFEGAAFTASKAEEIAPEDGETYCLKLKALTRNFTEFLNLEDSAKAADGVRTFANELQKEQLKPLTSKLKAAISETENKASELCTENEAKKEERRTEFATSKKRALKWLICAAVPFLALLITTIVLSTKMFADEKGAYLIATIVMAAVTFIALICTLIAANKYWSAARNCKLNEKDTSTKLGREYIKVNSELEMLKRIYSSIHDDIS